MRVAHHLAAEEDGVGSPRLQDLLRLARGGDQPDSACLHSAVHPHIFGESHLVAGADGDRGTADVAAGGDVEEVGSRRPGPRRDGRRLLLVPAALGVVGSGEPHQHGNLGADGGAHLAHDAQQKPRAVFERTAVLVVAQIAQGRQELVEQVAVRCVQLEQVEARFDRADRRPHEVGNHLVDARRIEGNRRVVVAEGNGRRGHRGPPAVFHGHGSVAPGTPFRPHRRLAPRVGELDARDGALGMQELDDAAPRVALSLIPDTGVFIGNAPLRADGARLGDDEPGSARGH